MLLPSVLRRFGNAAAYHSFSSIKRFECHGQISLISLTKLCVALDCADELRRLFSNVEYASIEEVLRERTQG